MSQLDSSKLVFVDETGTDDNIYALYGYSEIGKRSYSTKDAFKKQRLSTIAGYSIVVNFLGQHLVKR